MSDDGDDRDGRALALRLAAAVEAGERETDDLAVVDEASAVEPTADGAFAYAIGRGETRLAEAFVHPDRIHVEFAGEPDRAASAAARAGLRVRPKAVRPPRTLVFVEGPDEVEAALDVLAAVGGTPE
ncbi:hypothetical protein ACFQMA_02595 [Halosimplex aquaticum]|uniref:DUF7993 domain-containing protein n=1 Tax=Halosimplex aquaticum TaxID=3026162 RepID=A0ABD5XYF7_9EURY|nr:hypothetical protein [Halosimplex aquaticum]